MYIYIYIYMYVFVPKTYLYIYNARPLTRGYIALFDLQILEMYSRCENNIYKKIASIRVCILSWCFFSFSISVFDDFFKLLIPCTYPR